MTEDQIVQLAQETVDQIKPEERFNVLLATAQMLFPGSIGYVELYSELRQFIREASINLHQEGLGDLVAAEDAKDAQ